MIEKKDDRRKVTKFLYLSKDFCRVLPSDVTEQRMFATENSLALVIHPPPCSFDGSMNLGRAQESLDVFFPPKTTRLFLPSYKEGGRAVSQRWDKMNVGCTASGDFQI